MIATIYKITNTVNGKSYIGFTTKPIETRLKQHIKNARQAVYQSYRLYRAFNKYGVEHFQIEAIYQSWDRSDCFSIKEPYFISKFGTYHTGYNCTLGGDGVAGVPKSDDARRKISEANKGRPGHNKGKPMTEEQKQHLSEVMSGRTRAPFTDETRQKMSAARKGKPLSEETKEKLRQINLGKKQSEETIQKKVEAMRGKKQSRETIEKRIKSNAGFTHSDETKAKLSQQRKGKPLSDEHKANLRAAAKRRRERAQEAA